MTSKTLIAIALGAAMIIGGAATVSALGNMNGTCDQDRLQDGSCDECPDDCPDDDIDATEDCDSCNEYDYDFLYGETELEPPHESSCGQE